MNKSNNKNKGKIPKTGSSTPQARLNDKKARKYMERLIKQNFNDEGIGITLTYDRRHLPNDGDIDAAVKDMQNYIRRINYQGKKKGLSSVKYIYVTEYNARAEVKWHHHIIMDNMLDVDTLVRCWAKGSRQDVRRNENHLSEIVNYVVEEKKRIKSEKRWVSSINLIKP